MMMMTSRQILFVLVFVVIILLGVLLYRRLSPLLFPPLCAGYIDPSLRYCQDNGTMVSGQPIPEAVCNPLDPKRRQEFQLEFLAYLRRVQSSIQPSLRQSIGGEGVTVYQGFMLFSIPPLLKILPSDFGQNEITPYGVMSFFPTYLLDCVLFSPDADANVSENVCNLLFPNASPVVDMLCRNYVDTISHEFGRTCPFDVNTQNPSLDIQDPRFFHLVGTLGAFSMNHRQGAILYIDLPVAELNLDYWSFTLYLGDRLKPQETCTPYRQTYLASVASPVSAYNVPAIAGKAFNAVNGTGDVQQEGHVRGYIILALDSCIADFLTKVAQSRGDADFVTWMQIPSTMTIDPSIPNPNQLTPNDLLYNPDTDRLSLFLRLSPSKTATSEERMRLQHFVEYQPPYTQSAVDLCFVEWDDDAYASLTSQGPCALQESTIRLDPVPIPPLLSERFALGSVHKTLQKDMSMSVYHANYDIRRLSTRSTLFNVFSPFTPSILNTTTIPYRGGWQAIQLAGCAQGDNPDAIYRLSEGVCLATDDVMYGLFVNHAYYGNSIYNNVNVLDLNKAYSFGSVSLNRSTNVAFYIVITGRNADRVSSVERLLRQQLSYRTDIGFYSLVITTGPTVDEGVPMCHQIMMVERIYVNPLYRSLQNPSQTYSLYDILGDDLHSVQLEDDEDRWKSLVNVTAPEVTELIPPSYVHLSYPSDRRQLFSVSLGLFVVIASYGMWKLGQDVWKKRRVKTL